MREDLPLKKLGDVCHFIRGPFGGSLKKNCFVESGHAVYEQRHAIYDDFKEVRYFINDQKFEEMKRFELLPGDLIMSCSGTMGKVAVVPNDIKKGIINQALLKLTPSRALKVEYLRHWMESPNFQDSLARYSKGAAIKNIASVKVLKEVKIPCPSISEQEITIGLLLKAFTAIDQAKSNLEKNIGNTKELFQSKLEEIFTQKGEGWEEKSFKELSTRIGDGLHGTPEYDVNGDYYFINGNNLNDGVIEIKENTKRVNGKEFEKHYRELTQNTLLISINGTLGKVAFYNGEPVILGKSACYINFTKEVNKYYIKYLVKSSLFFKNMTNQSTGATIKNFSLKSMRDYKLLLPSIDEQDKLVADLILFEKKIIKIENYYKKKIGGLQELKKSILQKAFAGELTRKEIEV